MLGIIKDMRKLCPGISEKAMEEILRVGFELYARRRILANTREEWMTQAGRMKKSGISSRKTGFATIACTTVPARFSP